MVIIPPKLSKPRAKRKWPVRKTPAATLNLVGAEYNENGYIDLIFDRAVGIAGIQVAQIFVSDPGGEVSHTLVGSSASLFNATTVRVMLVIYGPPTTGNAELTASASTGIVATNDGGTWAGVTNESVPFP